MRQEKGSSEPGYLLLDQRLNALSAAARGNARAESVPFSLRCEWKES
jgi:hypothetical protein